MTMENMTALVSAVITTYKRKPEFVLKAIKSVVGQTYQNIEILVIDDSPDSYEYREHVKTAIESLEGRIRYIQHSKNMGACVARNTGLYEAKEEFIAYLDDDDEWLPQKIELQLQEFTEDNIALVYCGHKCIDDATGKETFPKTYYRSGYIFDELIMENFIGSTSFPLLRKNCLEEIGGFDPLMKSAQDYDVWLRLAEKYKIGYTKNVLVTYHVHSEERISSNPQNKIDGRNRLHEKNREYLKKNKKAWWYRHIRSVPEYARNEQYFKALYYGFLFLQSVLMN